MGKSRFSLGNEKVRYDHFVTLETEKQYLFEDLPKLYPMVSALSELKTVPLHGNFKKYVFVEKKSY
jgi:hypothetical protein